MRNDLFKPDAPPAGQVTPDRVETFVEELRARVGSVTTASTIYKLRRAAELLDPNRDFTWLAELEKDFALMMRPKSKDHRIVDPDPGLRSSRRRAVIPISPRCAGQGRSQRSDGRSSGALSDPP
jgi:hypothetical protein